MYESMTISEGKAINHLNSVMAKFNVGSPEYEIARRSIGWFCNNIRIREKKYVKRKQLD